MKEKKLLEKINSENATELFCELYGKQEIHLTRGFYTSLVKGFLQIKDEKTEGELRLFSAPGRTELAGNHTDHNRGKVLAASIQLDCIAVVQKRNDNIVFFRSAGYPDVKINLENLSMIPAEEHTTDALIRGIAAGLTQHYGKDNFTAGGFTASVHSFVVPGSGLSSSAAIEVLICRIFDSLYGKGNLSSLKIAQISQFAENNYFGKPCGLMDQTACATGGAVAIDFADAGCPKVRQINFDLSSAGYALCVVDTGGSHANLTPDYASVPAEMAGIAKFFGKSVLRELDKETVLKNAADLRKNLGDRALLRALHFFDENQRVETMTEALAEMEAAKTAEAKLSVLYSYLELVNESGDSSWKLLQNVYSPNYPDAQAISIALALTKDFFKKHKLKGACRVHGGGFAGTIQVYLPVDVMPVYRDYIETFFGIYAVTELRIRSIGAVELFGD